MTTPARPEKGSSADPGRVGIWLLIAAMLVAGVALYFTYQPYVTPLISLDPVR